MWGRLNHPIKRERTVLLGFARSYCSWFDPRRALNLLVVARARKHHINSDSKIHFPMSIFDVRRYNGLRVIALFAFVIAAVLVGLEPVRVVSDSIPFFGAVDNAFAGIAAGACVLLGLVSAWRTHSRQRRIKRAVASVIASENLDDAVQELVRAVGYEMPRSS